MPEPDAARLVGHVQAHAEGNPFYLREILRTLEKAGALRPDGDQWILDNLDRRRIPPLLRQVIDGRVARLGEEARDDLAVAAVIGQEVSLDVWSAVGGWPEEDLLAVVERAVEAGLLEASGDGRGVRFGHALSRVSPTPPGRKRTWKRPIGHASPRQA